MERRIIPLPLVEADQYIRRWHRDHKNHLPIRIHRFCLGLLQGDRLIAAIIIGYPMARSTDAFQVAEVTRLAANGSRNANSQLLAAASRAARAMGFARLQMFVEPSEVGAPAFLKAAGFRFDGESAGNPWHLRQDGRARRETKLGPKERWVRDFIPPEAVTVSRATCYGCGRRIPLFSRKDRRTCSDACRQKAYRRRLRLKSLKSASPEAR